MSDGQPFNHLGNTVEIGVNCHTHLARLFALLFHALLLLCEHLAHGTCAAARRWMIGAALRITMLPLCLKRGTSQVSMLLLLSSLCAALHPLVVGAAAQLVSG